MLQSRRVSFLCILLLFSFSIVSAQINVSGVVRDSASLAHLPFVNVSISGKVVDVSGENGLFVFSCQPGDTVQFSGVGFKTVKLIPLKEMRGITVLMSESTTLLKSVTIFGNYKPQGKAKWRDYIILPKFYQNPTMKDSTGLVQTFGAGGRISGPISYFTKYERERRKIKRVRTDLMATEIYREVMSSDKVKADLMNLFSLSEEQYFKKIEAFNLENPDAPYLKNRDEIMNLLIGFFALKEK